MQHEILKSIGKEKYATGNFEKSLGEGSFLRLETVNSMRERTPRKTIQGFLSLFHAVHIRRELINCSFDSSFNVISSLPL